MKQILDIIQMTKLFAVRYLWRSCIKLKLLNQDHRRLEGGSIKITEDGSAVNIVENESDQEELTSRPKRFIGRTE